MQQLQCRPGRSARVLASTRGRGVFHSYELPKHSTLRQLDVGLSFGLLLL